MTTVGDLGEDLRLPPWTVVVLKGRQGIGKTALAIEFARERARAEVMLAARWVDLDIATWASLLQDDPPPLHLFGGVRFQATTGRRAPELDLLPDRLTGLERRSGVHRAPSGLDAAGWNPFARGSGRINRLFRAALTATKAIPGSRRLAEVFRVMLRRIARAREIGRLLSLVLCEPDEPDPPGQLVTAQPHVTRGPTPARAVTVLSASRRLALR